MRLTVDSPELTAYALGELDPRKRSEVASAVAASEELRLEVEAIRATATLVTQALSSEPELQLAPERRRAILTRGGVPSRRSRRSRPSIPCNWWAFFVEWPSWAASMSGASIAVTLAIILGTWGGLWHSTDRGTSLSLVSIQSKESKDEAELKPAVSVGAVPLMSQPKSEVGLLAKSQLRTSVQNDAPSGRTAPAADTKNMGDLVATGSTGTDQRNASAAMAFKSAEVQPPTKAIPENESVPAPVLQTNELIAGARINARWASAKRFPFSEISVSVESNNAAPPAPLLVGLPVASSVALSVTDVVNGSVPGGLALAGLQELPVGDFAFAVSKAPLPAVVPLTFSDGGDARTFAMTKTDSASYSLVRSRILAGERPAPEFVQLEELINYFDYPDLDVPSEPVRAPVRPKLETAICPWNPEHILVRVALQARQRLVPGVNRRGLILLVELQQTETNNPTGSLLADGLSRLFQEARPQDQVALVTFSETAQVALAPTNMNTGTRRQILEAVRTIPGGGRQGLLEGLRLAYGLAPSVSPPGEEQRVVLAVSSRLAKPEVAGSSIRDLVRAGAADGVHLDIIDFGRNPDTVPQYAYLAGLGRGQFTEVETAAEVSRVLRAEGTPIPEVVAEGVRVELKSNSGLPTVWRPLGRTVPIPESGDAATVQIAAWNQNALGSSSRPVLAGTQMTALYELGPLPSSLSPGSGKQSKIAPELRLKVAITPPGGRTMTPIEQELVRQGPPQEFASASADFKFAAAVVGFGLMIRNVEDHGSLSWDQVLQMARDGLGNDPSGERSEFVDLVRRAKQLK